MSSAGGDMANVVFEDLSGVSTPVGGNPYESLIKATDDDPVPKAPFTTQIVTSV